MSRLSRPKAERLVARCWKPERALRAHRHIRHLADRASARGDMGLAMDYTTLAMALNEFRQGILRARAGDEAFRTYADRTNAYMAQIGRTPTRETEGATD